MIPLNAIPWKLVGAAALVATGALLWWRISAWHDAYERLPDVEAALKVEQECIEGSKCFTREQDLKKRAEDEHAEVVAKLNTELADIRSRPIPHRVIRVCNDRDLRDATVAAGTGSGPATPGVVPATDEFDTRPLRELAKQADGVSAQLRNLLRRDRALATVPAEK